LLFAIPIYPKVAHIEGVTLDKISLEAAMMVPCVRGCDVPQTIDWARRELRIDPPRSID
jgi:hypothetical protein